ncbi:hypothetical protein GCM10011346_05930 [Oceanobacillus neutriphilus]|uniref:Uncharacterized protein n=1 Tax=Oceanobacillus neutriphilus TaxID=531815 RepID=A0ABQ2NTJ3_9BACI|nr:hypothetical protein GCM10011346_05930 [Oceanobacillus neutriphilus]
MLFATQIIEGRWTFERVPSIWQEDVRTLLKAENRDDLIK